MPRIDLVPAEEGIGRAKTAVLIYTTVSLAGALERTWISNGSEKLLRSATESGNSEV